MTLAPSATSNENPDLYKALLRLTADELRSMAQQLGVTTYIDLSGPPSTIVVNLISFYQRHERIGDLYNAIQETSQEVESAIRRRTGPRTASDELIDLSIEIANIRQQLAEMEGTSLTNELFESRLQEVLQSADRAAGRSDELLTARLLLPSSQLTDVPLVPIHTLERLEEYRSDENIAHLFIGLSGGAVLGILSNWATDETLTISRFSIVLILVLMALTVVCSLWTRRIHTRAATVKQRMVLGSDV